MKISIIIPVCNGACYLKETLESITQQKRQPDEVIFSDDESSDNTILILEEFLQNSLFEVKILRHKPSGVTNNYLNAARSATGDIVVVADQDDWLHEERLYEVESIFISNPTVTLVSSDSEIVNNNLEPQGRTIRKSRLGNREMMELAYEDVCFMRFLRGGLPTLAHTLSFHSCLLPYLLNKPAEIQNWWFEEWLSCVAACLGKIRLIHQIHTYYRQHQNQTSKKGISGKGFLKTNPSRFRFTQRLSKMIYCLQLIENNNGGILDPDEKKYKEKCLNEYIKFLQKRNKISEETAIHGIFLISRMLFSGGYSTYSRGATSAMSDIYFLLRGN